MATVAVGERCDEEKQEPLISSPTVEEDDEEILEMRDPGQEPHEESKADARRTSPLKTMFGEVSVFRDFFLAAFSDGYYSVRCDSL